MSSPPHVSPARSQVWLAALLLVGLTAAAYLPSLGNGFVWDDDIALTANPMIHSDAGLQQFWLTTQPPDYWPMTATTLWIEWRLWAREASGYHATNLLFHLIEVLLLWRILERLRVPGAYLGALLFAVHPVNVESVAWITQRKNLVAMLFYLASIYAFVRWRELRDPPSPISSTASAAKPSVGSAAKASAGSAAKASAGGAAEASAGRGGAGLWYGLSLFAFVLAMLSKGSVAILPVVLLGLLAWDGRVGVREFVRLAPFFGVAGVLTLVDVWFQGHHLVAGDVIRHAGPLERVLGAAAAVCFYLSKAVLPINLTFFYPLWQIQADALAWWLPLLGALALTAFLCYRGRDKQPARGTGERPASASGERAAPDKDKHQRLAPGRDGPPPAGRDVPSALAGDGWTALGRDGRPARPACLWRGALFAWGYFCLALLPAMGFTDVYFMKFSLVADHYQHLALIGVTGLAGAAWSQLRWPGAPAAASRRGRFIVAALVVGTLAVLTWRQCRMYRDAQTLFEATIAKNPRAWLAHEDLGVILGDKQQIPEAMAQFEAALRLRPDSADPHSNLGALLVGQGRIPEGMAHYEAALRLNPNLFVVHLNLGSLLLFQGRLEEARSELATAVRLKPASAEAHEALGQTLRLLGRRPEAVGELETALRLQPDFPAARAQLALALSSG